MSRFTIFTIILAVSVVTVMADLVIREYYDDFGGVSVLRKNADAETAQTPSSQPDAPVVTAPSPATPKFDPVPLLPTEPAPALKVTSELLLQAGFTGEVKEEHFEGKIYRLLDITKIAVSSIGFHEIRASGMSIASVAEVILPDEIRALQMYVLLQNKTKPYIDLSLNETNAYGERSFYINHAKKPDEAFLTVKIGRRIYAIAYVKLYHPQVKELIKLLSSL